MKEYQCTICSKGFGSKEGARAHIQGSTGEHKGIGFADAEDHIELEDVEGSEGASSSSTTDSGTEPETVSSDGGVVPSDQRHSEPSDTSGADCCSSPDLDGSAGDVYQLENGQYIKLEQGDKICLNCEEIHD